VSLHLVVRIDGDRWCGEQEAVVAALVHAGSVHELTVNRRLLEHLTRARRLFGRQPAFDLE
jgi:hypothetical protein